MSERFVNVDRETPMLLPADLRQWVPEDDMVHFVLEAIEGMPGGTFAVNRRGSGSPQYPPQMMTALLVYCYSQGVFSSRRIERATWNNVAVRYLTGDTHPDHDTICAFRRNNGEVIKAMFAHVVNLAREMGVVKVGTVSVDGTHIKANASKHKSVRYDRAGELEAKLAKDIDRLLAEAEAADRGEQEDGNRIPEEIGRREVLQQKMQEARRRLEQRAQQQAEEKRKKRKGEDDPPSDEEGGGDSVQPRAEQQINLTDADSALMRKSRRHGWEQAYNAQVVVDAGGSQLILAEHVIRTPSDAGQLEWAWQATVDGGLEPTRMLADAGYASSDAFEKLEDQVDLYVAVSAADHGERQYDFRPPKQKPAKKITKARLVAMSEKIRSEEGRRIYAKRKSTVEPVFGIIKAPMGFRQFLLRGLEKVAIEWTLVCSAYNLKRLWALKPG
jgi:transposase